MHVELLGLRPEQLLLNQLQLLPKCLHHKEVQCLLLKLQLLIQLKVQLL